VSRFPSVCLSRCRVRRRRCRGRAAEREGRRARGCHRDCAADRGEQGQVRRPRRDQAHRDPQGRDGRADDPRPAARGSRGGHDHGPLIARGLALEDHRPPLRRAREGNGPRLSGPPMRRRGVLRDRQSERDGDGGFGGQVSRITNWAESQARCGRVSRPQLRANANAGSRTISRVPRVVLNPWHPNRARLLRNLTRTRGPGHQSPVCTATEHQAQRAHPHPLAPRPAP
jgi:hypothetical protein